MGKYQRFDEMPVWQEGARLYQRVLDMVEEPNVPLSATFRNQLERAALCVSSTVAEGFDVKPHEMVQLLTTAHAAAAEVQSMTAVISERPKVARLRDSLQQIRVLAESCARQLGGWRYSLQNPNPSKRTQTDGPEPPRSGGGRPPGSGSQGYGQSTRAGS